MNDQNSARRITGLVVALTLAMAWGVNAQTAAGRLPTAAPPIATAVSPNPTLRGLPEGLIRVAPGDSVAKGKPLPLETRFTPWTAEIVKLARAGIDAGVMLSYIDNCAGTFNLGADEIIRLSDLGVSSQVISTMIQHDAELAFGVRTLTASTVPGSGPIVHFTFGTGAGASAEAGEGPAATPGHAAPAITPAGSREGESGPDVDEAAFLSDLELALNDGTAPEQPAVAEPPATKAYTVRQPYPEEVLPPILVVKAAVRTPNVLVIEFSSAPATGKPALAGGKARE